MVPTRKNSFLVVLCRKKAWTLHQSWTNKKNCSLALFLYIYFFRVHVSVSKLVLFAVFLHNSHIWKNFGFWDMSWNTLGQPDYRIVKSAKSLEQNDETAWFLRAHTDSWKLKVDWKILGWVWPKMGVVILLSVV